MTRADGKSRDAEMRRNDAERNPAGTDAQRFQATDAPGKSSSKSRGSSGAERAQSSSSGRGGAGSPSGASSHNVGQTPDGQATDADDKPTQD